MLPALSYISHFHSYFIDRSKSSGLNWLQEGVKAQSHRAVKEDFKYLREVLMPIADGIVGSFIDYSILVADFISQR